MWVLSNELTPQDEKDLFIDGINWIDEKAYEIYEEKFFELEEERQDVLVAQMVELDYGATSYECDDQLCPWNP